MWRELTIALGLSAYGASTKFTQIRYWCSSTAAASISPCVQACPGMPRKCRWRTSSASRRFAARAEQCGGTPGGLIVAGGGTDLQGDGLLQYGGKIGQNGDYRVYGRYANQGE